MEERRVPPVYTAMLMGLASLGIKEEPVTGQAEALPPSPPDPPVPEPKPTPAPVLLTPEQKAEQEAFLVEYRQKVAADREQALAAKKQEEYDRLSESTKKALERAAEKRARRATRGW